MVRAYIESSTEEQAQKQQKTSLLCQWCIKKFSIYIVRHIRHQRELVLCCYVCSIMQTVGTRPTSKISDIHFIKNTIISLLVGCE